MNDELPEISHEAIENFHQAAAMYAGGIIEQMSAIPLNTSFMVAVGLHVSAKSAVEFDLTRKEFLEHAGFWFDQYLEQAEVEHTEQEIATHRSKGDQPC